MRKAEEGGSYDVLVVVVVGVLVVDLEGIVWASVDERAGCGVEPTGCLATDAMGRDGGWMAEADALAGTTMGLL